VTVTDLIRRPVLQVPVGTEVVWTDPNFERVWFPARRGSPRVERGDTGFQAVFEQAGEYRGVFTVLGHARGDVYPMRIVVTAP
jgi:hypothetical protein